MADFEYRLIRVDADLITEEIPLDDRMVQAVSTCLRFGLPVAPRDMRPKLQELREFLHGVPIEEFSKEVGNE